MWRNHGEYMNFVNQAWDLGPRNHNLASVSSALEKLQCSLKSCDKEMFGSVKRQIKELREELEAERSNTLYRVRRLKRER